MKCGRESVLHQDIEIARLRMYCKEKKLCMGIVDMEGSGVCSPLLTQRGNLPGE